MKVEAIRQALLRLSLAQLAFEQTRDLALHAQLVISSPREPLASALFAGIISSYSRPFKRNDGIGRLPKCFVDFSEDPDLAGLHQMLILARDIVYAHRDTTKTINLGSDIVSGTDFIEINLEIRKDDFSIQCVEPILDLSILPHINRLCDFQGERTYNESNKIVSMLKKEKCLSIGNYVIGSTIKEAT